MPKKTAADVRQDEIQIANDNWKAYQRAYDSGHQTYVQEAVKFNKYYLGDQWDDADIKKLEAEGRPHLTINLILKIINAFLGEQRKQRADLAFKPNRDASHDMAVLMSKLVEQILDHNSYEFVEREVFSDGLIQDRGYFDCRIDFIDNVFGDIVVTAEDPYEILPDPDSKSYDPKDWNEVTKAKWMTLDEIESYYGKTKRDEVEATVRSGYEDLNSENIRFSGTRTFGSEESYTPAPDDLDMANTTIRSVRVVERQWKKLTRQQFFVDLDTGDMSEVPASVDKKRAEAMAKELDLGVVEKPCKRIRWTVSVLNVVLHDDWSPYRSFTIIPYFPYFRKGKASGVVRQLISPQEQHNKYESQMLHVVNTSANSGWIIEAGSLANMTKEELEQRGAESGLIIEFHRGAQNPPEKIQPNQIPTGLDRIADRTRRSVSEIAGIDPLVGDSDQIKVGENTITTRQIRNMVQIQVPFDMLNYSRKLLGTKILELIQDFYSEPRILRVTNYEDMQGHEDEIPLNLVDAAGQIINNLTIGEYDLQVSTKPARDTYQSAQLAEALEMRSAGVMIPDDVVIRYSTMEDRFAVADRVARLQGTNDPTPEEQQIAQMQLQLQLAAAQAEVQKLQAQSLELQARAQEQYARAQFLQGQEQREAVELGAKYRKEMTDLQVKLQMQFNELTNKIQLAQIHSEAKKQLTMHTAATKATVDEIKSRTTLDVARINASSRVSKYGDVSVNPRHR